MWRCGERLVGTARRAAEQIVEARGRHGQALAIVEVGHVHPHRSVRLQIDELAQNRLGEARLAVRREPHQLVFAAVDREPAVVGERGIQQPQRVRKVQLLGQRDAIAAAHPEARRRPLADAVNRQDRRLVERRREERAGRMRLVVLGKDEAPLIAAAERLAHLPREMQLPLDPQRQRLPERSEPAGRVGEIGLEQPLELEQRLVVEGDVIELVGADSAALEAERDRLRREAVVVLPPGETLFLRGGHDVPVHDQRRRRIVVERRDSQDGRHGISRARIPSSTTRLRRGGPPARSSAG